MEFDNYSLKLISQENLNEYYVLIERNRCRLERFFTGTVSKTKDIHQTKLFIDEMLIRFNEKTLIPYLLWDINTSKPIGFFDVKNIDWSIPKAELGCYIDINYGSKGLTTKALKIFIEQIVKEYNFKKLFLRTHESNISAIKVALKCGFELEGKLRMEYKTSAGEIIDLLYYGKIFTQ